VEVRSQESGVGDAGGNEDALNDSDPGLGVILQALHFFQANSNLARAQ